MNSYGGVSVADLRELSGNGEAGYDRARNAWIIYGEDGYRDSVLYPDVPAELVEEAPEGLLMEAHNCDARNTYRVRFATEDQALAFITAKRSTHAINELEESPIPAEWTRLHGLLYPACEHGLDLNNCYGPQHYYMDDAERYFYGM